MTRSHAAVIMVGVHLSMWAVVVLSRAPLPAEYFEERDARIQRKADGGMSFRLITDVDPLLIVAERPFLEPMSSRRDGAGDALSLLNLPAVLVAGIVPLGFVEPALGGMGWRKASWIQTVVFMLVSSIQWGLVAVGIMAFRDWRRGRQELG